jgi:hypothetical protein
MGRQYETATRPISNAGLHKIIGEIPSRKGGVMLPYESQLERDYIYLCEYDPAVASIVPQPETVTIWIDAVAHQYTPDYRVVFDDGEICIAEVKPDDRLADPEVRMRLHAAGLYYAEKGIDYRVVLKSELKRTRKIPNIRRLYRYARLQPTQRELQVFHAVGEKLRSCSLLDFGKALVSAGGAPEILYHAMFHQWIDFDIDSELLNPATRLTWRLS